MERPKCCILRWRLSNLASSIPSSSQYRLMLSTEGLWLQWPRISVQMLLETGLQERRIQVSFCISVCRHFFQYRFVWNISLIFLSFFYLSDRRKVSVNMRTLVPQKLLLIDKKMRTVEATNRYQNLRLYLHFSSPVLNSSSEILDVLQTSSGVLLPTSTRSTLGNRRFGFIVCT